MDYMKSLASLSLGSRLKRLSEQLFADVSIIYNEVGLKLNPNYFLLMNLIHQQGAMSITQIAEALAISHPAVSKLASKMIQEGYLIKRPHSTDKRTSNLSLTPQSVHIIAQGAPTWKILKRHLDIIESKQTTPLLASLTEFESTLNKYNLVQNVLNEAAKKVATIEIVNWHNDYKSDFKSLNIGWLNSYFNGELTSMDKHALDHPDSYYLAQGGYLFFAKQKNKIIGCIAMKPTNLDTFEISKMAVSNDSQGQGVGRKLLLKAFDKARELQVKRLFLETNSQLKAAMHLYQQVGFSIKNHPNKKSEYSRADIYMELELHV